MKVGTKEISDTIYDHIEKKQISRSDVLKTLADKFNTIIAGEIISFDSYEYFFKGTPGKIKEIADITETQTYLKATFGKTKLTTGQKIAIMTIFIIVIIMIVALAALKGMGIINF